MQSRKYWNFSDTTSYKCHGQYKPLLKLRDRRNASQSQRSPGTGHLLAATSGSHSLPHSCKLFLHPSISQSSSETLKDRRIVSHQLSIILHLHFHLRPMTCPGCTGETQRRKNTTEGTGGWRGWRGEGWVKCILQVFLSSHIWISAETWYIIISMSANVSCD